MVRDITSCPHLPDSRWMIFNLKCEDLNHVGCHRNRQLQVSGNQFIYPEMRKLTTTEQTLEVDENSHANKNRPDSQTPSDFITAISIL